MKEGEEKISIHECSIANASLDDEYIITGCVRNDIVDGIRMVRETTFRDGIRYTGKMHMGMMVFESPSIINSEDWQGLSGSPVFNQNGNLVGMLYEVVDGGKFLYIMPIEKIIRLIEYSKVTEKTSIHKSEK